MFKKSCYFPAIMNSTLLYLALNSIGYGSEPTEPLEPKANICPTALGYKGQVEQILGRWPEEVLDNITSIAFLAEQRGRGEAALFEPAYNAVTITAIPLDAIEINIQGIDHEIGHFVYKYIETLSLRVTGHVFEEMIQREGEEAAFERIKAVDLYPGYTYGDWLTLENYLKEYQPATCTKDFVKAYYVDTPYLGNKIERFKYRAYLANGLLKRYEFTAEDRATLQVTIDDYKALKQEIEQATDSLNKIEKKEAGECYETSSAVITKISQDLVTKIRDLEKNRELYTIAQQVHTRLAPDNPDWEAIAFLVINSGEGSMLLKNFTAIPNEMYARAVASLMGLHYGPATISYFSLDDTILEHLERHRINNIPVFAESVARYKRGREMHKAGTPIETIREQLLAFPPRPYTVTCFETIQAWEAAMNEADRYSGGHK